MDKNFHLEENNETVPTLTRQLIERIKSAIENPISARIYEEWESPMIWKKIIKNLEDILEFYKNDLIGLARVQSSLAKYFDFYSLEWAEKSYRVKISHLTSKIVLASLQVIFNQPSHLLPPPPPRLTHCGNHEDSACTTGKHSKRHIGKIKKVLSLPVKHAINFLPNPRCVKLKTCDTLLRIIDDIATPYGNYWLMRQDNPDSRKNWRKNFAVLTNWNKGKWFVQLEISKTSFRPIVWFGKAASQQIPKEGCLLRGGANQIWIPPSAMKKLQSFISGRQQLPW